MNAYPLYFKFTNIVKTSRFDAAVTTRGRALLIHHEGDSWVCAGVEPGGLDAEGEHAFDASKAFGSEFQKVLEDLAYEAASYAEFQDQVRSFFAEKDLEAERHWEQAVTAIRAGEAAINAELAALERKPNAEPRGVDIQLLKDLKLDDWNDRVDLAADEAQAA